MQSSDATHPHTYGLFQLLVNTSGGLDKWSKVPVGASIRLSPGRLLGSDGTAIVYRVNGAQVNWSEVFQ